MHPASSTTRLRNLRDPIPLSGLLGLFFLLGPGTFHGFTRLLAYAGHPLEIAQVQGSTHALLQLFGFFILLMWGFLTNSLPGISSSSPWLRHIRIPVGTVAAGLIFLWLHDGWAVAPRSLGHGLLALGTFAATVLSLLAAFRSKSHWYERPFPLLLGALMVPPLGAALAWTYVPLAGHGKLVGDLLLLGCVIPMILAMGYRMFPSMAGFRFPHEWTFDAASAIWFLGVGARFFADVGVELPAWLPGVFLSIAAVLFTFSFHAFEPLRPNPSGRNADLVERAVTAYLRTGFVFLPAGAFMTLAAALPVWTAPYYAADAARHLLAIGFALMVVMALTQRIFPTLLRGKRSSGRWMLANGVLLVLGLLLRTTEVFLPASAPFVTAGAVLLLLGVLGYGVHLLRAFFVPAPSPLAPLRPVRPPAPAGGNKGMP